jgi:hypothetical protein
MIQFYYNIRYGTVRYEDGLKEGKMECCTEKNVSRDEHLFPKVYEVKNISAFSVFAEGFWNFDWVFGVKFYEITF